MVDLSRRHFLKQTFKFSVASTAAIATFPMVNLYQEKVRPVLAKEFPEATFSSDLSFSYSKIGYNMFFTLFMFPIFWLIFNIYQLTFIGNRDA